MREKRSVGGKPWCHVWLTTVRTPEMTRLPSDSIHDATQKIHSHKNWSAKKKKGNSCATNNYWWEEKKEIMRRVGFEPTRVAPVESWSSVLDQSRKDAWVYRLNRYWMGKYEDIGVWEIEILRTSAIFPNRFVCGFWWKVNIYLWYLVSFESENVCASLLPGFQRLTASSLPFGVHRQ